MKRANLAFIARFAIAASLAISLLTSSGCQDEKGQARERLQKNGVAITPAELIRAAGSGKQEIVRLFIKSGYDLDTQNFTDGRTPLTAAVAGGHGEVVDLLLEGGAKIDAPGPRGNTALMLAIDAGNAPLAKRLLERGASTAVRNDEEFRALELAAFRASPEMVRLLAPKSREQLNRSLHVACVVADGPTVAALLEAGADVNSTMMPSARTPLMMTAEHGKLDSAKALLERHADLNARDREGKTALMLAIENRYQEVVTLLQTAQNDPNYLASMVSAAEAAKIHPQELEMGQGDGPDADELAANQPAAPALPKAEAVERSPLLPAPDEMPTASETTGARKPLMAKLRDRLNPGDEATVTAAPPAALSAEAPASVPVEEVAPNRYITADGVGAAVAEANPPAAERSADTLPLRLNSVHREVLPLRFTGSGKGSAIVEVGGRGGSVHKVRKGQVIPGMGYRVTGISSRRGQDKFGEWQDGSTLYLENTTSGEQLTLVKNSEAESPSTRATFTIGQGGDTMEVSRGQKFALPGDPGREFLLEDVRQDQVVLQEVGTGNMYTVGR